MHSPSVRDGREAISHGVTSMPKLRVTDVQLAPLNEAPVGPTGVRTGSNDDVEPCRGRGAVGGPWGGWGKVR